MAAGACDQRPYLGVIAMKSVRPVLGLLAVLFASAAASGELVNYEMVVVGDAGNVNDTRASSFGTFHGAVPYEYRIGKFEVTLGQYTAFLNAVARTDTYGVYRPQMGDTPAVAGIARSGIDGAFMYTVIGPIGLAPVGASSADSRPIASVTWFDAARFANWMANGQPSGLQLDSTTEEGAYSLNGLISGAPPTRNAVNPNTGLPVSHYIPTENEWYKAAYYKGGSVNAGYWAYATQSDTPPGNLLGSLPNQANYSALNAGGPRYAVTQSNSFSLSQNYLSDVGAYAGSPSAYGTFDQVGNVWEWTDELSGSLRTLRGGVWDSVGGSYLQSVPFNPAATSGYDGFRLAAPVPEPSTYAMALAGLASGGCSMFSRRKRA